MLILKKTVLILYVYLPVFRLQMAAVTAKNTPFHEDLPIVVVKQVLVYNFKTTFPYVTGVGSSSFYRCKMSIKKFAKHFGDGLSL